MKVSKQKRMANAKNAQESTGPKSEEGKMKTKYNALKHGLLASVAVLPYWESQEQFDALHAALRKDRNPVGILETIQVESIAVFCWRLRRAEQCEVGEIGRRLNSSHLRMEIEGTDAFDEAVKTMESLAGSPRADDAFNPGAFEEKLDSAEQARKHLLSTSKGVDHILRVLEGIRLEHEESGSLSEASLQRLLRYLGLPPYYPATIDSLAPLGEQKAALPNKFAGMRRKNRKVIFKVMTMIEQLELQRRGIKLKLSEGVQAEAKHASLRLPGRLATDKLLRYETAIERRLYRAIATLEELQKQRRARERGQVSG